MASNQERGIRISPSARRQVPNVLYVLYVLIIPYPDQVISQYPSHISNIFGIFSIIWG